MVSLAFNIFEEFLHIFSKEKLRCLRFDTSPSFELVQTQNLLYGLWYSLMSFVQTYPFF